MYRTARKPGRSVCSHYHRVVPRALQAQDGLGAVLLPTADEEVPQREPRRSNPGRSTNAADGRRQALLPTEHPHLLIIVARDHADPPPHQYFGIAVEMQVRRGCLPIMQLEVGFKAREVQLTLRLREGCCSGARYIQRAHQRRYREKPERVSISRAGVARVAAALAGIAPAAVVRVAIASLAVTPAAIARDRVSAGTALRPTGTVVRVSAHTAPPSM